ncbi:hypothetical protein Tsubulata_045727 [Turnera subulata]|uniref:DUF676 domain-containing protein n=1 Tax=Turnera subulata TaxID=218843 RepID=A0A9Q0J918_9ROSI|nr:hypothetical protein Tsubulata_045727 [Turnera subulata]
MLRLRFRPRRYLRLPLPRSFSSSSSKSPIEPPTNLKNPQPPPPIRHEHPLTATAASPSSSSSSSLSRYSAVAVSATLLSAVLASVAVMSTETNPNPWSRNNQNDESNNNNNRNGYSPLYDAVEQAVAKSNESFRRVSNHVRQTGVAASVLWQSLRSVFSSANHEVRVGFELRVAAFLADISAANAARRVALVGAGGGKVVDWLLETVASRRADGSGTQAEAARALAYLIADPVVCKDVLARPHAVPNLLRFIFSCQPKKKQSRRSSFDLSDSLKGRSMLVAAIMDIVTSNCDSLDKVSFKPSLPGNADMQDILSAIEVIEDGGMHMDGPSDSEDDEDGGKGMKGIGIKILEGTTVLGLARTSDLADLGTPDSSHVESSAPKTLALLHKHDNLVAQKHVSSAVVPGLWDDLHCQHVAVPFAAWALANWAMASEVNRSHIQELDQDGRAVMTALMAPERSVKWHGSLVARLLLEDHNLPLDDTIADWSSSLLATISQAGKLEDIGLAQVALSAFLPCVERSTRAKKIVLDKGLEQMRDTVKRTTKHKQVQEALAKVLALLSTKETHLSLEESQKWSGILLTWVSGKDSSETIRSSAIKILSCILDDHGPSSIPISQGWLAIILNDVLGSSKASFAMGGSQVNGKAKTQIGQSNIALATQAANQLAVAVVNLAWKQVGTTTNSIETFPMVDLLSLEPFVGPFKNLRKDTMPKFNVADSAVATLKGIKALTELCSEDPLCQERIAESGILCLLRRFLLCDDYEKLAAMEAYDASRASEAQEQVSNATGESSNPDTNDKSSVRVPPTAHIRKHAARLLNVLSVLPKFQKVIVADRILCKWLENCANRKIPGCNDLKIQSYARSTLLNVVCNHHAGKESANVEESGNTKTSSTCSRYDDMLFLINPELPHWKLCGKTDSKTAQTDTFSFADTDFVVSDDSSAIETSNVGSMSSSSGESSQDSDLKVPQLDIVFVHGLRGGPYKTWRIADDKLSTKSGLVEKIDEEAGKLGTFWPGEWLSVDFPEAHKSYTMVWSYLTPSGHPKILVKSEFANGSMNRIVNDTAHSMNRIVNDMEVSSKLLEKLVNAGIGGRPVVFVTHRYEFSEIVKCRMSLIGNIILKFTCELRMVVALDFCFVEYPASKVMVVFGCSMGGLVVKQMLHKAKEENIGNLVNNTVGIVFYSCPHFGSKLADMPWRMGLVLRPAPTIGELRSGSPRLVQLNDFIRQLHKKGLVDVLSFCETKVTPIVEGYGGWAFRMEIVPIESAYPGFGELVVSGVELK